MKTWIVADLDEYTKELRSSIAKFKEMIKIVQKASPHPYYTCGQLYITEYALE